MSGNAAQEITTMLDNSIKRVESIVKNSQERIEKLVVEGKVKVDTGTRIANECGSVLNEIVVSVASVSKMAMEIATASQEQASGVHEITKAMAQLDQVTQQNSATTAQTASSAESLSAQAENLNTIVQDLVITIEGANQNLRLVGTPKASKASEVAKVIKEKPAKDKIVPIRKSEKKIVPSSQPEPGTPHHNDDRFADV
jgi:methyl-accepting chemotaxis protein